MKSEEAESVTCESGRVVTGETNHLEPYFPAATLHNGKKSFQQHPEGTKGITFYNININYNIKIPRQSFELDLGTLSYLLSNSC